ncbi:MAG: hypothetical protein AAB548_02705 [Patescibacteria group bacterium]
MMIKAERSMYPDLEDLLVGGKLLKKIRNIGWWGARTRWGDGRVCEQDGRRVEAGYVIIP